MLLNRSDRSEPFRLNDQREEIVDVGLAEKYLAMNHPKNRKRVDSHANDMARDMMANNFKYVPVAVCFDWDGYLRDGQHRLSAIIQTGIPMKMLIQENCDPEIFRNLDQGLTRTLSQSFYSAEAIYNRLTSAVIKIIYRLQCHDPLLTMDAKPTTNEALDLWEEIGGNDFFINYMKIGNAANKEAKLNPSVCTTLKIIHDIEDAEMSEKFWNNITDLRDISGKTDPSYSIVNFMRDEKDRRKAIIPATKHTASTAISTKESLGWIHIAWQYYCEGKGLSVDQAKTKFTGKLAVNNLDSAILDIRKTIEMNPIGTLSSLKK
jgi:hypothetical protein